MRGAADEVTGVGVIVIEITEEHRQQELLRLSELRYRTMANALPELIWTARPDGIIEYFNDRWYEYTGYHPVEQSGWRWRAVVHPDDLAQVNERWDASLASGEPFFTEARLRRHDGAYCWYSVHAVAFKGIDERVISWFGNCTDIDERKRQEVAMTASELRYRTLTESLPQMIWSTDAEGRSEFRSNNWFDYVGSRRGDLAEEDRWGDFIAGEDRDEAERRWRQSLATGEPFEAEFRMRRYDGTYRWQLSRAHALRSPDGAIAGWFGTITDIHDRKLEEVRQAFLAHASNILSTSLDYHETLASVARLAVPEIGDWCAVDVLENGTLERLAVAHVDPAKVQWAYEIEERYPPNREDPNGTYEVIRTGTPQLWEEIPEDLLRQAAVDEEHLQMILDIGFISAIVVPIIAAGETLGVITLVTAESNRRYDRQDLALAEELARRAGNAITNARLYGAEQDARADAEAAAKRIALLAETSELLGGR